MAPIKFEESIKETLEKRTIAPSEDSWEKLSNRLGDSNKKRRKNIVLWWSLAASVIVLFGLTMLFQDDNTEEIPSQMVQTETPGKEIEQDETNDDLKSTESTLGDSTIVLNEENNSNKKDEPKSNTNKILKKSTPFVPEESAIASKIETNEAGNMYQDNNPNSEKLSTKAIDGVAQTIPESAISSEAETDSLLKRAQRSLIKDVEKKDDIKTVEAYTLLQEVEGEIEESFRTKMFETLMDGIEVVKTSVAQRNN